MSKLTTTLVLWFLAGVVSTARATPIQYQESISGDLDGGIPTTPFILDVGANTIAGSQQTEANNLFVDFDSFTFTIPVGMDLVSISYSFLVVRGGAHAVSSGYALWLSGQEGVVGAEIGADANVLAGVSPVNLLGSSLPLGPGTYDLLNEALTGLGWSDTYVWTLNVTELNVTEVPEPASLLLVGGALLVPALRRRVYVKPWEQDARRARTRRRR